jgi:formylglycine-generating enzyme required for sulfatase activity
LSQEEEGNIMRTQVSVSAQKPWVDTGVDLRAGDALAIVANGEWTNSLANDAPKAGPDGFAGWQYPKATLASANMLALIGKVGDTGEPFFVGRGYDKTSPGTGRLYLQINNEPHPYCFANSSGELDVAVWRETTVSQAPGTEFHDPLTLPNGSQVPGPRMVVVPAGTFTMGAPTGESGREDDEGPAHAVTIAKPFAIGVYEVTFEDYDRFAEATGRAKPNDQGWGRGRRPVVAVDWNDACAYAEWLSQRTGKRYRLPSEAEWEYAARAGTQTAYWWGAEIGRNRANCKDCGSQWDGKQTAPVGSFEANRFGLYDTAGNVYEWVQDCWNVTYAGAPTDGSPWISGDCSLRVRRGGSWWNPAQFMRSADRAAEKVSDRFFNCGIRVARDL